jgi:hypothetical protein
VTTHVTAPVVLPKVGVTTPLATGKYITTGSGKNKTTNFSQTTTFKRGETVVIQATVKNSLGNPVANATFTTAISGPSSVTLTSGPSNATGIAEAKWTTTAPNKRGQGGTPTGSYSADLTGVTAAGYDWDGLGISAQFTITP